MNKVELKKLTIINRLIDKLMTTKQAADILHLSERQIYRLKARIRKEGETGIIHKNRGRKPAHALPEGVRKQILTLHQSDRYRGCNDYHLSELLAEHEDLHVSPSSVRRLRLEANIPAAHKRRPPKAYRPRERRAKPGELIQMDASDHPWLEDRSERFTLTAAIDDATGEVVGSLFRPTEDLKGYYLVTKQIIENKGLPLAIYTDRHAIFRSPKEELTIEQELAGEVSPLSQFGKAMVELTIAHPKARSPQAKGRIERLFQTFQDRLVKELRIRNITTMEEANAFLPELIEKHNNRFKVKPKNPDQAYRSLPEDTDLNHILCRREKRCIQTGQAISFHGQTYKVDDETYPVIPKKTVVEVRQTLDERMVLIYKGNILPLKAVSKCQRPLDESPQENKKAGHAPKARKPAANHPWRKPFLPKQKVT